MSEVFILAHAPTSVQRLEDFAKFVFNFGDPLKALIITKPSGVAAQVGVPDVFKMAYKLDKNVLVLPDIDDAIELMKPDTVYTITYDYGSESEISLDGRVMLVVGLTDPGLTKQEAQKGIAIRPRGVNGDVGPLGSLALVLAHSTMKCGGGPVG